jgi:hypothetical protein
LFHALSGTFARIGCRGAARHPGEPYALKKLGTNDVESDFSVVRLEGGGNRNPDAAQVDNSVNKSNCQRDLHEINQATKAGRQYNPDGLDEA